MELLLHPQFKLNIVITQILSRSFLLYNTQMEYTIKPYLFVCSIVYNTPITINGILQRWL